MSPFLSFSLVLELWETLRGQKSCKWVEEGGAWRMSLFCRKSLSNHPSEQWEKLQFPAMFLPLIPQNKTKETLSFTPSLYLQTNLTDSCPPKEFLVWLINTPIVWELYKVIPPSSSHWRCPGFTTGLSTPNPSRDGELSLHSVPWQPQGMPWMVLSKYWPVTIHPPGGMTDVLRKPMCTGKEFRCAMRKSKKIHGSQGRNKTWTAPSTNTI